MAWAEEGTYLGWTLIAGLGLFSRLGVLQTLQCPKTGQNTYSENHQ